MVYCYDEKVPSFRKELYEEYKANRQEMPEELALQIPYIKKLTEFMGIPSISKENYEADDLIGSLTRFGLENHLEVFIVSGDKDFAQLVGEKVTLYDTMKNKKYGVDEVMKKWGVHPNQFIDYLAITGDSSDNIPGVKGIGEKGAQRLLEQFHSLDGIYENIDLIKAPSQKKKLTESREKAYLSQKLVKIVNDLDLVNTLDDMTLKPKETENLKKILDELEFSSFKKTLLDSSEDSERREAVNQRPDVLNFSRDSVQVLNENSKLSQSGEINSCQVIDVSEKELGSLIKTGDSLWLWKDDRQFFVSRDNNCWVLKGETFNAFNVGQILCEKKIKWKGFDIKNLWHGLGVFRGEVETDVLLSAYLLKAKAFKNLNEIYQMECGKSLPEFPEPLDLLHALEESQESLSEKLRKQKMMALLKTMDLPLIEVLISMENKGVLLDLEKLKKEDHELEREIKKLEKEIKEKAGEDFNVASPKQLSSVLFEKMGLKKSRKTKTGYSTATEVLEKLIGEHPIIQKILDYRELSKLKSTYVSALPQLVNEDSGRVHTVFNQALTSTGRLSSNHPNLQNIPIRTERGRKVREAFIVPPGMKMLSADYSQIELRVLAHITEDRGLVTAFNNDRDIHRWTASEIFSIPFEEVDSNQRRTAKAVNFGIAYGQGVYGLSETLKITRNSAEEIIKNYFEKFPGVKTYMDQTVQKAKKLGYVETLFGRRRYLPELFSKNPMLRQFGERAAINAPIQGTASDLVKMVMLELFEHYPNEMLLQVHDELLFELNEKEIQEHGDKIKQIMENNISLKVRLKVNIHWGDHWAELH